MMPPLRARSRSWTVNIFTAAAIAIGSTGPACAQSLNWAVCGGPLGSSSVMDLAYDANGDLFVGGYVAAGALDIDPGTDTLFVQSGGTSSSLLAKYTANGELLWAHVFGDTLLQRIHAVAPDGQGGVVVAGLYTTPFDIDPGPGTWMMTVSPGSLWNTTFLARFDANGALQWALSLGAAWAYVVPSEVAVDDSGNLILFGSFDNNIGSGVDMDPGPAVHTLVSQEEDTFVAKYSPSGAYLWAFTLGGVEDFEHGNCLACDGSGNVYVGLEARSMGIDADPGPGQYLVDAVNTRKHMLLASYEPGGAFRWAFTVGVSQISSAVVPLDITVDDNDDVIVSGYATGTDIDFDPSADTTSIDQSPGMAIFLAKYSAAGALVWCNELESTGTNFNRGWSLDCTPGNDIVLAGEFTGDSLDADPSPGHFPLYRIGGIGDSFAALYTAGGGLISAFNISSSSHASPFAVASGNGGALAMGGHFEGTDFDPEPWATGPTYDAGNNGFYLTVYKDLATSIQLVAPLTGGLSIVPNPGDGRGPVRVTSPGGLAEVSTWSMNGTLVRAIPAAGGSVMIDPSGLAPGLYLIRAVTRAGALLSEKLVIEGER
ncbi:MAG: T9SS type A sorting domain-containing protein [Flavobacteriales bacterium]|nr:T9SS type A sorting domain-containing protein [Flavobacteriales bacterium]